jgi:C4-dicarboxylate-specific signal transduction histidine kinase
MPDGGVLAFETSVDAGEVVVRVRDTGSGIRAELKERVFEPFFSTKGPEQGTGLGLFVSRTIVQDELGGRLELERSDPQGSVFAVRLPAAPRHPDVHAVHP